MVLVCSNGFSLSDDRGPTAQTELTPHPVPNHTEKEHTQNTDENVVCTHSFYFLALFG